MTANDISRRSLMAGGLGAALAAGLGGPVLAEQRNSVAHLRGPYNLGMYHRHNFAYRIGAGMHFFHSKQHDLLHLTSLADPAAVDASFDRTEPRMPY